MNLIGRDGRLVFTFISFKQKQLCRFSSWSRVAFKWFLLSVSHSSSSPVSDCCNFGNLVDFFLILTRSCSISGVSLELHLGIDMSSVQGAAASIPRKELCSKKGTVGYPFPRKLHSSLVYEATLTIISCGKYEELYCHKPRMAVLCRSLGIIVTGKLSKKASDTALFGRENDEVRDPV